MSHYANYRKERERAIVKEDKYGFVSAIEYGEYFYIDEVYVIPESRREGHAERYNDLMIEEAKYRGFSKILGSVDPKAKGSTNSIKLMLKLGYELYTTENDLIYLIKEI